MKFDIILYSFFLYHKKLVRNIMVIEIIKGIKKNTGFLNIIIIEKHRFYDKDILSQTSLIPSSSD